ncbi:hypothetical protein GCM10017673_15200 [Streptosporangium violaceochromogenes]|nr:hypothetical protein GCM10017673_15200 [Streptosporangium violaceochromogenes]
MATTLRSLLPAAAGSVAVLSVALTLRTGAAAGGPAPEAVAGPAARGGPVLALDAPGAGRVSPPSVGAAPGHPSPGGACAGDAPVRGVGEAGAVSPLLAALLRMLTEPAGCARPPY